VQVVYGFIQLKNPHAKVAVVVRREVANCAPTSISGPAITTRKRAKVYTTVLSSPATRDWRTMRGGCSTS